MKDSDRLVEFINFTYAIREVKRKVVWNNGTNESDAEHLFQMAITAIYIIDSQKLKLDKFKCAAMALMHDVCEAYAGDTSVFASKKDRNAQTKAEHEAFKKLEADWPEFPAMHELIKEYEELQTPESKFVYALDKLLPEINNYLAGGTAWKQQGINLEQVKKIKLGKVDKDPTIKAYHNEILKLIEAKPELFTEEGSL